MKSLIFASSLLLVSFGAKAEVSFDGFPQAYVQVQYNDGKGLDESAATAKCQQEMSDTTKKLATVAYVVLKVYPCVASQTLVNGRVVYAK